MSLKPGLSFGSRPCKQFLELLRLSSGSALRTHSSAYRLHQKKYSINKPPSLGPCPSNLSCCFPHDALSKALLVEHSSWLASHKGTMTCCARFLRIPAGISPGTSRATLTIRNQVLLKQTNAVFLPRTSYSESYSRFQTRTKKVSSNEKAS